jgi:hypothetical protein
MFKNLVRNIAAILILTLAVLATPTIHASTTASTPPASASSGVTGGDPEPTSPDVTGGDPEPTSPDAVQIILILLHLA